MSSIPCWWDARVLRFVDQTGSAIPPNLAVQRQAWSWVALPGILATTVPRPYFTSVSGTGLLAMCHTLLASKTR